MAGKKACNKGHTQAEPLINIKRLKQEFLFGVVAVDNDGNDLPDSVYHAHINNAVSIVEHLLDIAITPRTYTEEKDYYMTDYFQWGYMQLNNYPLLDVESMEVVYLHDENNDPEVVLEIPRNWIRVDKETGILRLLPNNKFPSRLAVDSQAAFFPELFRRNGQVPNLWRITYKYGFEEGKVPVLINLAIGLLASLFVLHIAGDLVIGAGIANSSISLDGLSQSIGTTASAENHAYSAKANQYRDLLLGRNEKDPGIMGNLMDYYKGRGLNIV